MKVSPGDVANNSCCYIYCSQALTSSSLHCPRIIESALANNLQVILYFATRKASPDFSFIELKKEKAIRGQLLMAFHPENEKSLLLLLCHYARPVYL